MNKSQNLTIRRAQLTDIDAVREIHRLAYPNDHYDYANNIKY